MIEFVKYGNSKFLVDTVQTLYRNYPPHKLATLMNFMGSHDTERITTVLGGEPDMGEGNEVLANRFMPPEQREKTKDLLHQAYLLLASLPGVPCIFYGDEIAMEGYHDPFNRRPFPTKGFEDGYSELFGRINKLRAEEKVFKSDRLIINEAKNGVVRLVRLCDDEFLTVVSNMSDEDYSCKVEPNSVDLITGEKLPNNIIVKAKKTIIIKTVKLTPQTN
jgi:glycosidase